MRDDPAETPRPPGGRSGVALCLSGGGFRAALFHLGAVRRLDELGVLGRVDTVSSVSGGSILAAHLAARLVPWPAPGERFAAFDERVAAPFREVVGHDLRTRPVVVGTLRRRSWRLGTRVEALAAAYERHLTGQRLDELPTRPRFVICATDLAFGVNFIFSRERVGDYQVGYLAPAPAWPVARAVAASSCFPPVFPPLELRLDPRALAAGDAPAALVGELAPSLPLTDGGVSH